MIVFWATSEADKQALVQDKASPFFTTAHFDGHPSVLLRASRIGELTRKELAEVSRQRCVTANGAEDRSVTVRAAREQRQMGEHG